MRNKFQEFCYHGKNDLLETYVMFCMCANLVRNLGNVYNRALHNQATILLQQLLFLTVAFFFFFLLEHVTLVNVNILLGILSLICQLGSMMDVCCGGWGHMPLSKFKIFLMSIQVYVYFCPYYLLSLTPHYEKKCN